MTENRMLTQHDNKLIRRRHKYRIHQQRHRARLKNRLAALENDVFNLEREIDLLKIKSSYLGEHPPKQTIYTIPNTTAAKTVVEYFELFRYGLSKHTCQKQIAFLRSQMVENIEFSELAGVEDFILQWQLYASFFKKCNLELANLQVHDFNENEVVVVTNAIVILRPKREGVIHLYPSLAGREDWVQRMMNHDLKVAVRYMFHFNKVTGKIQRFFGDGAYIAALQEFAGSFSNLQVLLSDCKISTTVGTIRHDRIKVVQENQEINDKMDIDYLLV